MADRRAVLVLAGLVLAAGLARPGASAAHPLGNFSINHYTAIRVGAESVELSYVIDMAEIPTFQELQDTGIRPEEGHPSLPAYLARKAEALGAELSLRIDGRRVALRTTSTEVIFPPGAGGLPTLKLAVGYRAAMFSPSRVVQLEYADGNFPGRAGWKEIIAVPGPGGSITKSSVPATSRSGGLADYPTDLLDSPPQDLEARVVFSRTLDPVLAVAPPPARPATPPSGSILAPAVSEPEPPRAAAAPGAISAEVGGERLAPNRQARRDAFADLVATGQLSFGIVLVALVASAGLGAFHALEPGHGKTIVAAYLVGTRGTARHAVFLGLVVTAAHTAGVYLLGAITLYASRYVVPERIYPWLGAASGLIIAALGVTLFLRRSAAPAHGHAHSHDHAHGHAHDHSHDHGHGHGPHQHAHEAPASLRELFALGVSGGIVPCPAALVVLLSALSLRRVGFGLVLILAFSVGLAAVLIAIGLLMVYARRLMGRVKGDGPLVTRWLPLTSAAVITLLGLAIAVQALVAGDLVRLRL